ncbi:M15 family metallopeptidase [Streptomyces sp. TRM66268-LWL]|uniref:D-alanyl-D-alanine dipeptidase n=1 Tax=Streptomyces polyasparticus TaxID=2767826 RepID=A0ABR7SUU4_9ACTN|nr:M15 family metallopeptidase [Streptomyces polyasparticus]MBC9718420.1 M15 family metallopeptidase [Streptomyces polyasparticus]
MSDPSVAAIPVVDCREPLVDVRRGGALITSTIREDAGGAFAYLRRGVLERLLHAQSRLPSGLRFLFVEGYRPPALQRRYFEAYADGLHKADPTLSPERLRADASRFVSPPEIAPHSAGAAVDLTLVDADGQELDMGTRVNANPEESKGACYTHADTISPLARANRTILCSALCEAGLVNYPTEWWHWSFGDRYAALMTGQKTAVYGPIELDALGGEER